MFFHWLLLFAVSVRLDHPIVKRFRLAGNTLGKTSRRQAGSVDL